MNRREALNLSAAAAAGAALPGCALGERAPRSASNAPSWPDRRLLDLARIEHPTVQAPMGWNVGLDMPSAVSGAGGLGSIPCAGMAPAAIRDVVAKIRAQSSKPLNLNFFCHAPPRP